LAFLGSDVLASGGRSSYQNKWQTPAVSLFDTLFTTGNAVGYLAASLCCICYANEWRRNSQLTAVRTPVLRYHSYFIFSFNLEIR